MTVIAGVTLINGVATNGAIVNAYKASRFGGIPALNAAPPAGAVDGGPVTSTSADGGVGNFQIIVPTNEPYYCSATSGGQTAWQLYLSTGGTAAIVWDAKSYGIMGDGSTDDTVAINSFFATVAAGGGGTTHFTAGTYLMTGDLLPPSNVIVRGVGAATIFKNKTSGTNIANCLKLNNVSNVRLVDFAIDGNKANIDAAGSGATYTAKQGVYITGGSHDIVVSNLTVHDTFAGGVVFDNASALVIEGNRFLNCGDNAIFGRPSPIGQAYVAPTNFTVVGNKVSGGSYSGIGFIKCGNFTATGNESYANGPTAGQGSGFTVEGCTNFAIDGNQVHDNGVNGIDIRYSDEGNGTNLASAHGTVTGNQTYNNGFGIGYGNAGGIVTEGANDILFSGNHSNHDENGLNYGPGNGLDPTNITSAGNMVNAANLVGIRWVANSAAVNLVSDGDTVLASGSDSFTTTALVTIKNPHIAGPTGANKENIHFLAGSSNSRVLGGVLRDPIDNCILIDTTVVGVRIRGTVFNKGSGGGGRALYESTTTGAGTVIEGCEITGFTFQSFTFNNTASIARNNIVDQALWYDYNSGTATITAGATTVVVTHNLYKAPVRVQLTPTTDTLGKRWWVSAKGATTFTISIDSAGGSNITFDWRAFTWDI